MNISPTLVAHAQPTILIQPGHRALDDPAELTQAAPVCIPSAGQSRLDAHRAQRVAMRLRVVGAIPIDDIGTTPGAAELPPQWRNLGHESVKLCHIVTIRACRVGRQGRAVAVGQDMVLRAVLAAIRGIWAGLIPPKTARTLDESTTTRDQLILSAPWSFSNRTRWTLSQTPAAVQSRNRLQQLIPLPQPSSWGRCSQPMPVRRTKRMPVKALRDSIGLRPGYRARRGFGGGRSGSMSSHNWSSNIGLAILVPPCG